MTGASSQAGTQPANRRPTPRAPRPPPRSLPDSPTRVKRPQPAPDTHARNTWRLTRPGSPGNQATNPRQRPETPTITGVIYDRRSHRAFALQPAHLRVLTTPGPSWMTQDSVEAPLPLVSPTE